VAEGRGMPGTMVISLTPVRTRFLRITQTATTPDVPPWSMRSLRLYQQPD
jgi:hypothetical protein